MGLQNPFLLLRKYHKSRFRSGRPNYGESWPGLSRPSTPSFAEVEQERRGCPRHQGVYARLRGLCAGMTVRSMIRFRRNPLQAASKVTRLPGTTVKPPRAAPPVLRSSASPSLRIPSHRLRSPRRPSWKAWSQSCAPALRASPTPGAHRFGHWTPAWESPPRGGGQDCRQAR
jgi:hypothetical protein